MSSVVVRLFMELSVFNGTVINKDRYLFIIKINTGLDKARESEKGRGH